MIIIIMPWGGDNTNLLTKLESMIGEEIEILGPDHLFLSYTE